MRWTLSDGNNYRGETRKIPVQRTCDFGDCDKPTEFIEGDDDDQLVVCPDCLKAELNKAGWEE